MAVESRSKLMCWLEGFRGEEFVEVHGEAGREGEVVLASLVSVEDNNAEEGYILRRGSRPLLALSVWRRGIY